MMDIKQTVEDWLNNKLEGEVAEEVHDLVTAYPREGNPWRDALNEALSIFQDLRVARRSRRDSLGVALDEHEIDQAKRFGGCVLSMPLPHRDASLEAVVTPEGILFHVEEPHEEIRTWLVPWGTKEFRWSDRVVDITFQITERVDPVEWRCRQAANDICALAYGTGHSRALEHAVNVIEDIHGYWLDQLAMAEHVLEEGLLEESTELEHQVASLLCLRIHLDILAKRMCDGYLDLMLEEVDELLAPHQAGLLALDDDRYQECLRSCVVSERTVMKSWWGYPALLEQQVPRAYLELALEELALERGVTLEDDVEDTDPTHA